MKSAPNHRPGLIHPMVSVPGEYLRLLEAVYRNYHTALLDDDDQFDRSLAELESWMELHDYPPEPEPAA